MRLAALLAFMAICPFIAFGQKPLNINITHYYSYSEDRVPKVIYQFAKDIKIEANIDRILKAGHKSSNFKAIAANVSSVVVARNKDDRFLLYNPSYLNRLSHKALQLTVLAHCIGYHVNEDLLEPTVRISRPSTGSNQSKTALQKAEELHADRFAGYALYNLGIPTSALSEIVDLLSQDTRDSTTINENKLNALLAGSKRAEAYLLLAPSASFQDNGSGNAIPGIPEFPYPPPPASAIFDLTPYFRNDQTIGESAEQIEKALNNSGYYDYNYYYVDGGFAMATQIEQYSRDGSCLSEKYRWSEAPYQQEGTWGDYFRNLFTSKPGRFRVFVFIVTNTPLVVDTKRSASREVVNSWLTEGARQLPPEINQISVTNRTTFSVLIYDFIVEEATKKATLRLPSNLSSHTHLVKSTILKSLRK